MASLMKIPLWMSIIFIPIIVSSCGHSTGNYPKYNDYAKSGDPQIYAKASGQEIKWPNFTRGKDDLAPGFSYTLFHSTDKKLNGTFRSDFKGKLRLPYNVVLETRGKKLPELANEVRQAYGRFFRSGVDSVTFKVYQKRYWIEVRGLVKKTGRYLVKRNETLDRVLEMAGGINGDINKDYFSASLNQGGISSLVILNQYYDNSANQNPTWIGGDLLTVSSVDPMSDEGKKIPFVSVMGGVNKPGQILFKNSADLFYYLNQAGGTVTSLGYSECYIYRKMNKKVDKIQFNLMDTDSIPVVFPGDVIMLNTDIRTKGDRWLDRLVSIASLISTVALLIIAL